MPHLTPAVPASPIERERPRPIAHRTEKIQQMLFGPKIMPELMR